MIFSIKILILIIIQLTICKEKIRLMTQELKDLFGSSATEQNGKITIDCTDFVDNGGNLLLANPETATAEQKLAAWMSWLHRTQLPATDEDGLAVTNKTDAIVPQTSFTPKTFEVREDETQLKHEFNFAVYTMDNTGFDPDDVV